MKRSKFFIFAHQLITLFYLASASSHVKSNKSDYIKEIINYYDIDGVKFYHVVYKK